MSLLSMKAVVEVTTPKVQALREETERLADAIGDLDLSKLSEGLSHLLGASEWEGDDIGPPQSSIFDVVENGQVVSDRVAGAFSDKYAGKLVEAMAEALRRKAVTPFRSDGAGIDPARFEQDRQKADWYFNWAFGNRFGKSLTQLAEELNKALDAAKAAAKKQEAVANKQASGTRSSGTLSVTPAPACSSSTNVSIKILQQAGKLK